MSCDANKKKVQHLLHGDGKHVKIEDLHNIMSKQSINSNQYEDIIKLLKSYSNVDYSVLTNNDKSECRGIYIQTDDMKKKFDAFPEIVFLDSTYKLNKCNMPLYVLICMDSNGESEVIALAFVQHEDKETLAWIAESFVERNQKSCEVKCIMTDKDITERETLKTYFPDANLLICTFHALRNFKREVTYKKWFMQ